MGVIVTGVGVTTHVVDTTSPLGPVTVSVYVFPAVSAGVAYDPPLTAAVVMSELPTPVDPITAVPFENVGTSITVPLYGGVVELGTKLAAMGIVLETVSVAATLVADPAAFVTTTV